MSNIYHSTVWVHLRTDNISQITYAFCLVLCRVTLWENGDNRKFYPQRPAAYIAHNISPILITVSKANVNDSVMGSFKHFFRNTSY